MSQKIVHFVILLPVAFSLVAAMACSDQCRRTRRRARAECTKNSFVRANCAVQRCRFSRLLLFVRGLGWHCTRKDAAPAPTPFNGPCPSFCLRYRVTATVQCSHMFPKCGVKRCRRPGTSSGRRRLGYQCTERSRSRNMPSPNPTPFESPTATPSLIPGSDGVQFAMNTFVTGAMTGSMEDIPSTIPDDPRTFSMSYNLTVNGGGAVSINGVAESVSAVTCFLNRTIRITLSEDMTGESLEDMYPLGAVLVIDQTMFGECLIEEPVRLEDNEEDEQIRAQTSREADFRDTYLRIESVSGTPSDAFISGSVTELVGLFSEGQISVVANEPTLVRTHLPTTARMRTISLTLSEFAVGPLEIQVMGSLIDNGGFRVLSAEWDLRGVDFQIQFAFDLTIRLDLNAALKVGIGGRPLTLFNLLSVPLYGIRSLPFIRNNDDRSNVTLPDLKMGVFLEVPLVVRLTAELEKDLGTQAFASYSTGRKEITFFVTGPFGNIDSGIRVDRADRPVRRARLTPMLNGDDPVTINFVVFTGIRPRVVLYLPFIQAGFRIEVGIETTGEFALPGMAFPPNMMRGFGVCDTCHLVTVDADFKVQNAAVFLDVRVAVPGLFGRRITLFRRSFSRMLPGNPTLSRPIANACFVREFGDKTEICGSDCCNTEEEMCMNSGSPPALMCSGSPSPSPSQTPSPTPTPGRPASCYTDPHLRTFDGLYYDCQAIGEFTMVKSEISSFEVQARFTGITTRGTVTTGIAVSSVGTRIVQVSMAINNTTPAVNLASCPVIMFVDGVLRPVTSGTGQDNRVAVSVSGSSVVVALNTGISVSFTARDSSSFGCYFERLSVFLPESIIAAGPIVGLLGTPNNNPMDDWMTSAGEPVTVPTSTAGRLFQTAYEYCTRNWCVRDETNSLFTYEEGTMFSDFNRCDTPYGRPPDFSTASPALQELCGDDSACIVDGLAGDIDDARVTLTVQAQVDSESTLAQEFQFDPPIIVVERDVNVMITLDLSRSAAEGAREVERFNIFRANSDTGEMASGIIAELFDNGLAVNSDTEAGDLIFSNILAIRSNMAGERFGFQAIPVVSGVQMANSPFAQTALTAIRSYSRASAIGGTGENALSVRIGSISGLELIVRYSWPMDQPDLDTSTEFSGENVGFGCRGDPLQYVTFSGDDTSTGGTETVTIQLDQARVEGDWTNSTTVACRAGWFSSVNRGPASLRMVLRDAASGLEIPNTGLSLPITPGFQRGCARMLVATLEVTVDDRGVTLMLVPATAGS